MKPLEFLTSQEYTVSTAGVYLDDLIDGWGIDVNYDPNNSNNNRCEITFDESVIKLSEKKEAELFDYLHSLWIKELDAEIMAIEDKNTEEFINYNFYRM